MTTQTTDTHRRSTTPLALWHGPLGAQDPTPTRGHIPGWLASGIVEEYSSPSDVIVDAAIPPGWITVAGARAGREVRALTFGESGLAGVQEVVSALSTCDRRLITIEPVTVDQGLAGRPGDAASLAVVSANAVSRTQLPKLVIGCSSSLRRNGLLVIVPTPSARRPPTAVGSAVALARECGLTYLQHVVAITAQLAGDRLVTPTPAGAPRGRSDSPVPSPRHTVAHVDVLVFRKSHDSEESTHGQ